MAEQSAGLGAVEAFLNSKSRVLAFPPALEAQFERETGRRRAKRLQAGTLATAGVYNLFLFGDILLAPDQFGLALVLHFALVTPLMLAIAAILSRPVPAWVREGLAAALPVAIVAQILAIFVRSRAPHVEHYQYYVLLALLYTGVIQRLSFDYARVVCAVVIAAYAAALLVGRSMPPPVAASAFASLICCAYLSLVSNFYLERDFRRSYLHALRDRLRQAQAEAASRSDALTELGNRHMLNERLADLWQAADPNREPVAAVMLDLDHFKTFNDRYGHPAGDTCLRRVAGCVAAELRGEDDFAVRYGGEEMLVILPATELGKALEIASRIRRAIEAMGVPHDGIGARKVVTASFGVAAATTNALSSSELIATADVALYAAKRQGRNQVWPPLLRDPANSASAAIPFSAPAKAVASS